MKKIYFTIVLLIGFWFNSHAQPIYTQYFDGADTGLNSIKIVLDTANQNIWQIGKPQKIIFDSASTLPNAIVTDTINFYPTNNTSRFIAKIPIITSPWIFALQWKQKLDLDAGFDGGIIEYSKDTGNTWLNVFNNPFVYNFYGFDTLNADTLPGGQFAFSGKDTTWRDIWLCFQSTWLQPIDTLLIRFTLLSDSVNNNKEGWLIDNMMGHITIGHTIKEVEQKNYINVYPNPVNNRVYIQLQKQLKSHIIENMELMDLSGRVVERWSHIPTKFWFDTHNYADGKYFLKIKTNIKSETVPLLIRKY